MATYQVFNPKAVQTLAKKHQKVFKELVSIEKGLNNRFTDMADPIHALILAVASGEPLLFIGPPGTAKSRLIRAFCALIGLIDLQDHSNNGQMSKQNDYFEYLLTPFTEPGELFGYYEIIEEKGKRHLNRNETGMMQQAKVVYLDEVFNGSSAILNSILAFVNERVFHDRGVRKKVALQVLFGATNHIPTSSELQAIYDRFLLRCAVNNIPARTPDLKRLLEKGWQETYSSPTQTTYQGLLDRLAHFQHDLRHQTSLGRLKVIANPEFLGRFAQRISRIRRMDLSEMSNRRVIKMLNVMLIHSIYEATRDNRLRREIPFSDAQLNLLRFAQDRRDELVEQQLQYQE